MYLFRTAENGGTTWSIGERVGGKPVAVVQDKATVAEDILGVWAVFAGDQSCIEDHGMKVSRCSRNCGDDGVDAVVVRSRYGNIAGGYRKSSDIANGCCVYNNDQEQKKMWYSGAVWVIGEVAGSSTYYVRSLPTFSPSPEDVKWEGITVEAVEEVEDATGNELEPERDAGFLDPDFAPDDRSLGLQVAADEKVWLRVAQVAHGDPGGPRLGQDPGGMLQGASGDCWLLAAIAALAEFPSHFPGNIFQDEGMNPGGRCTVRLYDVHSCAWVHIVVDDFVPCRPKAWYDKRPRPLLSQPMHGDPAVLLLEKALAKYVGSYAGVVHGFESLAWVALTGQEHQLWWVFEDAGSWNKRVVDFDHRRGHLFGFEALRFKESSVERSSDDMFPYLASALRSGCLVSASIPPSSSPTIRAHRGDGLVARHCYSLLDCVTSCGTRFVLLRNPWGDGHEWSGAWGGAWAGWRRHPSVRSDLLRQLGGSGGESTAAWLPARSFLMEWQDFSAIFTVIYMIPVDMGPRRSGARQQSCGGLESRGQS